MSLRIGLNTMRRTMMFIVITGWILASAPAQANAPIEALLQASFTALPNSMLRAGMEVVAPLEAELLKAKLSGLYKQCKVLERRQSAKKRSTGLARRKQRSNKNAPQKTKMVTMLSASELAKMKNDHNNAVRRASELEDYLVAVQAELSSYMSGSRLEHPFVNTTYRSLRGKQLGSPESFSFIIRNLDQLIQIRLLPDVQKIKTSIQKSKYKDCRKQVKGYADA